MMTKESEKGLKVSRNGENEKTVPTTPTKELGKEPSSSSSGVTLKLTGIKGSSSPEKENNQNFSTSSSGGEASSKEKNNKYSSSSLSPTGLSPGQGHSSREQEKNKKNIASTDGEKGDNRRGSKTSTSPSIAQQSLGPGGQGPSSSSTRQIRIGSASSDRSRVSIDNSGTGEPMGLPSEQLLVHPSTNGHDSGSVKNGLKRQNSGRQKCRCWCCCCSCSCLALRNNEPKSKDAESDLICDADPPPTLDEIRGWGDSFDHLMRSSGGRKVFRDFLKCEYSEENILFWLACEELKKESKPEVIEEKARLIYEDYISILSPKEVSLDSRVRDLVNQNMRNPKPSTFEEAQLQIYTLMHRDSYPRFVNSPLYKKLAQLNSTETGASTGNTTISTLGGGASHRGSTVSATTSPASRKQSAAS